MTLFLRKSTHITAELIYISKIYKTSFVEFVSIYYFSEIIFSFLLFNNDSFPIFTRESIYKNTLNASHGFYHKSNFRLIFHFLLLYLHLFTEYCLISCAQRKTPQKKNVLVENTSEMGISKIWKIYSLFIDIIDFSLHLRMWVVLILYHL